jgi:hypothetical protein
MPYFDTVIAQHRDCKARQWQSGGSDRERNIKIFFSMARQHPVDQALRIIDAWRLHANSSPSLGLLWTSDQPDAETSTWQHNTDKWQTTMTSAGHELAMPTSEKSDTNALDHVTTTQ